MAAQDRVEEKGMILKIKHPQITEMLARKCNNAAILAQKDSWYETVVDSKFLKDKDIDMLIDIIGRGKATTDGRLLKQLNAVKKSRTSSEEPFTDLNALTEVLIAIVQKLPNKRVYIENKIGNLLPWYVQKIRYVPPIKDNAPYIDIQLVAMRRNKRVSDRETIYRDSLRDGMTGAAVFAELLNWQLETGELHEAWNSEIIKHREVFQKTGKQFLGVDMAEAIDENEDDDRYFWHRGSSRTVVLGTASNPRRLIMDDMIRRDEEIESDVIESSFWAESHAARRTYRDVETLPLHPIVRMFDLSMHEFVLVHVNQIEPYEYDTGIADKLVMKPSKRWMIDALINMAVGEGSDIIRGKSGGTIVLSSGPPGTGKTLTAEIYAEQSCKPLYNVQCSQLGITPDTLEKKLGVVLERAQRWDVVLLMDEADVYIHERGADMTQNAVVGIFLRLLEYYSGILFLTTNRETLVDDAIISRVTAHVKYDLPEADERRALWGILAAQYKLATTRELRDKLVAEFPSISGRTIMKLVRLVKVMSTKLNTAPTIEMFKEAALFQKMESRR